MLCTLQSKDLLYLHFQKVSGGSCRDIHVLVLIDTHTHTLESTDSASYLNGLLVMQDVQLGTLVALMPLFADNPASLGVWNITALFYGFLQLLQTLCGFCLLVIIARQLTNRALEKFYKLTIEYRNRLITITVRNLFSL